MKEYLDLLKDTLTFKLWDVPDIARNVFSFTMVSRERLDNVQYCIEQVLSNGIEGDFIECGVWRGGACIFAKGVLNANNSTRKIFVADSFEGHPPDTHKQDTMNYHNSIGYRVGENVVKNNFSKFKLLDKKIIFIKGWFKDTLPTAPIDKLSVIRLDGDMYESTMDALMWLYPKLSHGGYCIIDDYFLDCCKSAVNDYRNDHEITDTIMDIDGHGVFWKKE